MRSVEFAARRGLIAGLYAAIATGPFYGFSVYSLSLKAQCGLSQSALSNINTIPYGLGVFSPLIGAIGRPLGARGALFVGGLLVAVALVAQFILATHCHGAVRSAAPILLVLCSCLTYIGLQFVTSVAFPVPVLFWPINRSQVTAAVKSFVGLGGAAVAQSYRLLYGTPSEDPVALRCMLLWAGISLSGVLVGVCVLPNGTKSNACAASAEPRRALDAVFVEIAMLGVFATATPLVPDGPVHTALVGVLWLLALLPVPLALLVGRGRKAPLFAAAAAIVATADADTPNGRQHRDTLLDPNGATSGTAPGTSGGGAALMTESVRQFTLREMVLAPDAWLLWIVAVVQIGAGSMLTTNLAVIIQAAAVSKTALRTLPVLSCFPLSSSSVQIALAQAPYHLVTSTGTTFSTGNLLCWLIAPLRPLTLHPSSFTLHLSPFTLHSHLHPHPHPSPSPFTFHRHKSPSHSPSPLPAPASAPAPFTLTHTHTHTLALPPWQLMGGPPTGVTGGG